MRPIDFCRWLQGALDMSDNKEMDENQVLTIRKHLNLVFEDKTGCASSQVEQSLARTTEGLRKFFGQTILSQSLEAQDPVHRRALSLDEVQKYWHDVFKDTGDS